MSGTLTKRRRRFPINFGKRNILKLWQISPTNIVVQEDSHNGTPAQTTQYTESYGHHWPPKRKFGGVTYDRGGPFYTYRSFVSDSLGREMIPPTCTTVNFKPRWDKGNGFRQEYSGPLLPFGPAIDGYFPLPTGSTDAELAALGTTAIARCNPTKSASDAFVFLGELYKERLPSLPGVTSWENRARIAKSAGSEYLNVQFGWRPLISEVDKMVNAVKKAHTVLSQYERDSGKNVRRNYRFDDIVTEETVKMPGTWSPYGPPADFFTDNLATVHRTHRVKVERWFNGCFTYYLPAGKDYRSAMLRQVLLADKLVGVAPTPDSLWELSPWSWALDWFSSTGDVISNLSAMATQGLVIRYGYMMEKVTITDTYFMNDFSLRFAAGTPPPPSQTSMSLTTVVKKRVKANPFGFGLSWDGLSPFQLSIIAALGMSKGRV